MFANRGADLEDAESDVCKAALRDPREQRVVLIQQARDRGGVKEPVGWKLRGMARA
jgi:hypothetical protein